MKFTQFWFIMNLALKRRGEPEMNYGEAHDIWRGHQDALQYPEYRNAFTA